MGAPIVADAGVVAQMELRAVAGAASSKQSDAQVGAAFHSLGTHFQTQLSAVQAAAGWPLTSIGSASGAQIEAG
jgi:hypothetical protein